MRILRAVTTSSIRTSPKMPSLSSVFASSLALKTPQPGVLGEGHQRDRYRRSRFAFSLLTAGLSVAACGDASDGGAGVGGSPVVTDPVSSAEASSTSLDVATSLSPEQQEQQAKTEELNAELEAQQDLYEQLELQVAGAQAAWLDASLTALAADYLVNDDPDVAGDKDLPNKAPWAATKADITTRAQDILGKAAVAIGEAGILTNAAQEFGDLSSQIEDALDGGDNTAAEELLAQLTAFVGSIGSSITSAPIEQVAAHDLYTEADAAMQLYISSVTSSGGGGGGGSDDGSEGGSDCPPLQSKNPVTGECD